MSTAGETGHGSLTGTESCLTRVITIIALTCFLIVGAAAASILGRNSVPAAGAVSAPPVVQTLVSNKEGKQDRLPVAAWALAAFEPPRPAADLNAPLRQAFAAQT